MQVRMGVALVAVVAMGLTVGCASKAQKTAQADEKQFKAEQQQSAKAAKQQAEAEAKAQKAEAKRLAAEDKARREQDAKMAEQVRKENAKYEREQREAIGADIMRDERDVRAVDRFAKAESATGAYEDLMLNDSHFDSAGNLNSLGQSKLALVAHGSPTRGAAPATVYVGGIDDKAAQPRIAAVQSYLKSTPHADLGIQVKGGMHDMHMTPANTGLKGLAKQDKAALSGGSSSGRSTGSSSSGSGSSGSSSTTP